MNLAMARSTTPSRRIGRPSSTGCDRETYAEWLVKQPEKHLSKSERERRRYLLALRASLPKSQVAKLNKLVGRYVELVRELRALDGEVYEKGTRFVVRRRFLDRVLVTVRYSTSIGNTGRASLLLKPEWIRVVPKERR